MRLKSPIALHADAAAVDDAERPKTQAVGFEQVFLHHGLDVARRDGVQIEDVSDGNADGLVGSMLPADKPRRKQKPGPAKGPG